jgi:glycosyltransferase involved in cell wall biosynthesis
LTAGLTAVIHDLIRNVTQVKSMASVLFYSDAGEFGGHEAMTAEAIRCLCRNDVQVSALFCEGNTRFGVTLAEIAASTGKLQQFPLPAKFKTRHLAAFRSLISVRKIDYLQRLMKQINPDVVIVSQGRIEGSSLGLLAAKRAGFRTISYLPMAHPVSVSGKPVAVRLREMVNGYFYRMPDKFITISESARTMLQGHGAREVVVVPNGIEVKSLARFDRERFREEHQIGEKEYAVGTIGRIDFRQKGQDFAVEAIGRFRRQLDGYRFVFVGEGPGEQKLKAMILKANLSQLIQVLPWRPDPSKIYAGLDMLMIPSRFEGVPLVMLEAMSYSLPIIATNTDAMAELLPHNWLFEFGDHQALFDRLVQVRHADNSEQLALHWKKIAEEFSCARFCSSMTAAVLDRTPAETVCTRR